MRSQVIGVVCVGAMAMGMGLFGSTGSAGLPAGPRIRVPRGPAIVIDGRISTDEWTGAATETLSDGSVLRLRHDGQHLFLGITAKTPGFPSVCVSREQTVRVLHASAALGSVTYASASSPSSSASSSGADGWNAKETEFVYGMRGTALDDATREERRQYLSQHGFVASTFRMGEGLVQEMQIALDVTTRTPRIALGYFATAGDSGTVIAWPGSLGREDGCASDRLVRGYVPRGLRFDPAQWALLELS